MYTLHFVNFTVCEASQKPIIRGIESIAAKVPVFSALFPPDNSPAFKSWVSIARKKQVPPGTEETRFGRSGQGRR
jgi:hypothetical protein